MTSSVPGVRISNCSEKPASSGETYKRFLKNCANVYENLLQPDPVLLLFSFEAFQMSQHERQLCLSLVATRYLDDKQTRSRRRQSHRGSTPPATHVYLQLQRPTQTPAVQRGAVGNGLSLQLSQDVAPPSPFVSLCCSTSAITSGFMSCAV